MKAPILRKARKRERRVFFSLLVVLAVVLALALVLVWFSVLISVLIFCSRFVIRVLYERGVEVLSQLGYH